MLAQFLCAAILSQSEDPPKLRSELANGVRIFVERSATPNIVTVELYASNEASFETPDTHGFRHLVEHIAVRGKDRGLDKRLESKGLYLTASTTRMGMAIQITGPSSEVGLAIDAMNEISSSFSVTEDQIVKESQIINEENALLPTRTHLATTAWSTFFETGGLDAFGNVEVMAKATVDQLTRTHSHQFLAHGLSLVVIGDLPTQATMNRCKALFEGRSAERIPGPARISDDAPAKVSSPVSGAARAVLVEGFPDVNTMAALAAAFAFQSEIEGLQPVYTVSGREGVITLCAESLSDLGKIDQLASETKKAIVARGRRIAVNYIRNQIQNPSSYAHLRAVLLRDHIGVTPEDLLVQAVALTDDQILVAMGRFAPNECVQVAG